MVTQDNAIKKRRAPANTWKPAFLSYLSLTGNVTRAAEAAGVERPVVYRARERDEAFAAAWDAAIEQSVDALEEEARKRALGGSDTLLIFLLKGARPDRYRDNYKVEHSGGVTVRVVLKSGRPLPGPTVSPVGLLTDGDSDDDNSSAPASVGDHPGGDAT